MGQTSEAELEYLAAVSKAQGRARVASAVARLRRLLAMRQLDITDVMTGRG